MSLFNSVGGVPPFKFNRDVVMTVEDFVDLLPKRCSERKCTWEETEEKFKPFKDTRDPILIGLRTSYHNEHRKICEDR
ncbi:hypothetical protein BB559_003389 [Furculomyces boomerangus]|uniref:Uncharacterized protein n=2 Tax=Harpellales TaxID=61421 RepID=A0A2T9YLI9_9FUNG|nr:hypothetical protein BB559_003389 [Furculomyces boomerangus]PWA03189.1 hypothetical protein BB558_000645 [Smittium angustum]